MQRQLLRCKLHHARITEANVEYTGSLTIDEDLMDAAGIAIWEKLLVANVESGGRLETYAIPGPRGSGAMCLNGAAAHLGNIGDRIIVMVFGIYAEDEKPSPKVLVMDEKNRITETIEACTK